MRLVKRFLSAVVALAALGAHAELTVRNGANSLSLLDAPCSHAAVLGQVVDEWRAQFKNAQSTVNGHTWLACWIRVEEFDVAYVIYEDTDRQHFPMSIFKDEPGV